MLLNRGARIMEISEDGKECLSEPELIWYGWDKHGPEASYFEKGRLVLCFLAEVNRDRTQNYSGPRPAAYGPL